MFAMSLIIPQPPQKVCLVFKTSHKTKNDLSSPTSFASDALSSTSSTSLHFATLGGRYRVFSVHDLRHAEGSGRVGNPLFLTLLRLLIDTLYAFFPLPRN